MEGLQLFNKGTNSATNQEPELLVGLELGTSKVAVVVAERESRSGGAQIIGIGQAPSRGIRKGQIVNLEQAVQSVRQALSDAENMVGLTLSEATVTFSGSDVLSIRSKGMVSLGRSPRQVMQLDIERVIEAAQTEVSVPVNQCILHMIPVGYSLDGHSGIDDPLGMTGMRLEIELQTVIVPMAIIQNVINCVEKAGLDVTGLIIKPLASALGSLFPEEEMAGVVSVDVGGGTTGVAVFSEGRPLRLAVIPVGGDHISNDLACVLRIPISKAEEIKKEISLGDEPLPEEGVFEFELRGKSYTFSANDVCEVVRCRLEELYGTLVRNEILESGLTMFPSGIVLTGGVARTPGLDVLVGEILDMPVRLANPVDASRMPPGRNGFEYSAAAGIIRYMVEKEKNPFRFIEPSLDPIKQRTQFSGVTEERARSSSGATRRLSNGASFEKIIESIKRSIRELF